jgi:hypothetical protein
LQRLAAAVVASFIRLALFLVVSPALSHAADIPPDACVDYVALHCGHDSDFGMSRPSVLVYLVVQQAAHLAFPRKILTDSINPRFQLM